MTSALCADTPVAVDAPPTDEDLAGVTCSISEEKFLPADYYYCLASQNYGYKRYDRAQRYFLTSASWASKPAQYVLGVMALNGDQQPVDRPLALAWFTLATERHQSPFDKAFHDLQATASPDEKAAANVLLEKLRATYADDVAAVRAERRYRDGVKMLERGGKFGVHCLAGAKVAGGGASESSSSNATVACVQIAALVRTLDQEAEKVFDGWAGHVTVGSPQTLPPNAQ